MRIAPALVTAAVLLAVSVTPFHVPTALADHSPTGDDPPFSVPPEDLDAALDCTDLTAHSEHEPVLLVHGTFAHGHENFAWNWELILADRGIDHCVVTYPNRGMDDIQMSAEYAARAVQVMHVQSGRKVDVIGHSQGALVARWAVKWWPSVQAAVDDVVLAAGPNHGTSLAEGTDQSPFDMPGAFYQMDPGARFIEAINRGDETPGAEVEWTSLYSTLLDELVQPDGNVPGQPATAAIDGAANVTPQQLCPGRVVDHLTVGTVDLVSVDIVLDAFTNEGPADLSRLDPVTSCAQGLFADPRQLPTFLDLFQQDMERGFPDFTPVDDEPPLMPYARPTEQDSTGDGAEGGDGSADATPRPDAPAPEVGPDDVTALAARSGSLPATGAAFPLAAALALAALGLATRRLTVR